MSNLETIRTSTKRQVVLVLAITFSIALLTLTYGVVFLDMASVPDWLTGLMFGMLTAVTGYVGVSWWYDKSATGGK
jgi:hypothetical protein